MRLFLLSILTAFTLQFSYAININIDHNTFRNSQESYVELSMYISGSSLTPIVMPDSNVYAAIEVLYIFKQGENIIQFDKFRLNSPSGKRLSNFVDLKRYALPNGDYQLEVSVTDTQNEKNTYTSSFPIHINYNTDDLAISDIALLASVAAVENKGNPFEKMGMILEPLPHAFYNRNYDVIPFYCEIYNSNTINEASFAYTYTVSTAEGKVVFSKEKKKKSSPLLPLLEHINAKDLPSGEYTLTISLTSTDGNTISSSTTFWRSNPGYDQEQITKDVEIEGQFVEELSDKQVEYSLRAIATLVNDRDVEVINYMFRDKNIKAQRMFLLAYWRKKSEVQPQVAYSQFMTVARAVDKEFRSGFRYGFESDRGRVFLKYGRPNTMERREQEMSAPPYEIWTYNSLEETGQTNVHFIFYNPTLAGDDYQLLHSNALGEHQNPNWERTLYDGIPGQIQGSNYFDGTGVQDGYNRNAKQILDDY